MRLRIFVDFWNFTLAWNERSNRANCDWRALPRILTNAATRELEDADLGSLQLEETRVYASYEPGRDYKLRRWLYEFLDRQPGIRVFTRERHWRQKGVHCRSCNTMHTQCFTCNEPLGRASEKTIDAWIVADMMSLAWEDAYDVALLVSSDADYIQAVENLQSKNFKVVNATWQGCGHELAQVSWASIELNRLIDSLTRGGDRGGNDW